MRDTEPYSRTGRKQRIEQLKEQLKEQKLGFDFEEVVDVGELFRIHFSKLEH